MKIGLDYSLAETHKGGMGVFVRNIYKELKSSDKNDKFLIFSNPNKFQTKNIFTKIISVFEEHLWYQTKFLYLLNKEKVDLLYSPNPPVPLFFAKPIILTIPDMAFYYEDKIPYIIKKYLLIEYHLAAKKAKRITTFSEHSKKDIQKILKIIPDKISVIPLAASNKFKKNKDKKSITNTLLKYHITKPFILCTPGSFLPRKNVGDLILAVSNLSKYLRNNLQIVLVGKDQGIDYENINKYIEDKGRTKHVIFTGYIEPESQDLINIYSAAKIFAYPSLYEGFGLPPLEAMKIGIPVIVYNKTSLPEVVGDAGLIVNNHRELTLAITRLLKNKKLCDRLGSEGIVKSKKFSWKTSAIKFERLINPL